MEARGLLLAPGRFISEDKIHYIRGCWTIEPISTLWWRENFALGGNL